MTDETTAPAGGDATPAPASAPETGSPARPSLDDALARSWDELSGGDRALPPRGPGGRFASPNPTPDAPDPAAAQGTDPNPPTDPQSATDPAAASAAQPIAPPEHWSAEHKAAFQALQPEAQAFVMQRYQDMERGYQEKSTALAGERRRHETLAPVLNPIRDQAQAWGISEGEVIHRLWSAHTALQADPAKAMQAIARSYGIDLQQLVAPQGAQPAATDPEAEQHPIVVELRSQIAELQKQIGGVTTHITQGAKLAEQSMRREANDLTAKFASEKDEAGQPRYPHFEAVRADMAILVQTGRAPDLATAYDMAVHLNPETRKAEQDRLLAKAKADAEAAEKAKRDREEAERKKAVEDAKKVTKINAASSPLPGAGKAKPKSTDEAVRQAYEELERRSA